MVAVLEDDDHTLLLLLAISRKRRRTSATAHALIDAPEARSCLAAVPTMCRSAMIERAARLTLYIELMDRDALEAGTMTEGNSEQYLAWVNALRLCLREIGVEEAQPAKAPDLSEYLSQRDAEARWQSGPSFAQHRLGRAGDRCGAVAVAIA